MQIYQINLIDPRVREWMLEELMEDMRQGRMYYGRFGKALPSTADLRTYRQIFIQAAAYYDNTWMDIQLGLAFPNMNARYISDLTYGEFNRLYIRGVCLRAQEMSGDSATVRSYRGRDMTQPKPDSPYWTGRRLYADRLLAQHRAIAFGGPIKVPNGYQSGLTVCLEDSFWRAPFFFCQCVTPHACHIKTQGRCNRPLSLSSLGSADPVLGWFFNRGSCICNLCQDHGGDSSHGDDGDDSPEQFGSGRVDGGSGGKDTIGSLLDKIADGNCGINMCILVFLVILCLLCGVSEDKIIQALRNILDDCHNRRSGSDCGDGESGGGADHHKGMAQKAAAVSDSIDPDNDGTDSSISTEPEYDEMFEEEKKPWDKPRSVKRCGGDETPEEFEALARKALGDILSEKAIRKILDELGTIATATSQDGDSVDRFFIRLLAKILFKLGPEKSGLFFGPDSEKTEWSLEAIEEFLSKILNQRFEKFLTEGREPYE